MASSSFTAEQLSPIVHAAMQGYEALLDAPDKGALSELDEGEASALVVLVSTHVAHFGVSAAIAHAKWREARRQLNLLENPEMQPFNELPECRQRKFLIAKGVVDAMCHDDPYARR